MIWLGTAWAALTSRAGQMIAAVVVALGTLGAAYMRGRRSATEREKLRQAEAAQAQARERANADQHAARSDDPAGELRRDWRRPG